jgi:hypothetical protein
MRVKIDDKLKDSIKDYFLYAWTGSKEEAIKELKHYRDNFPKARGYNLYAYGNICPYYTQMRRFCHDASFNADTLSDITLQYIFEKHIEKAVDEILKEVS